VLLSFFQAEAEKRHAEATTGGATPRRVVYAIEEPETSQHPDSLEQIIRALRELADGGDQVLLTTHVPGLARLLPVESLRYVDHDPETGNVRVRGGSTAVYSEIADGLGVLPDPVSQIGLKVAVLVEGKNDIDALRSMAQVLTVAGELAGFDESLIFWTIGGGTSLNDWIERGYLEKLGIPQVIIRDSDRSAAAIPLNPKKERWLREVGAMPNITAFLTSKRSMDNYIHPDVIVRMTGGRVSLPIGMDIDYVKMADELGPLITAAKAAGLLFNPDDLSGSFIAGTNPIACRRIISAYLMRHMTADEIRQRSIYADDTGVPRDEIRTWFDAILVHIAG
jgi:hypothetical protein